jgi:hypothetical protein
MPAAIASPATIRIAIVPDDSQIQAAVASAVRRMDDRCLHWVVDTLARGLHALNDGPAADHAARVRGLI